MKCHFLSFPILTEPVLSLSVCHILCIWTVQRCQESSVDPQTSAWPPTTWTWCWGGIHLKEQPTAWSTHQSTSESTAMTEPLCFSKHSDVSLICCCKAVKAVWISSWSIELQPWDYFHYQISVESFQHINYFVRSILVFFLIFTLKTEFGAWKNTDWYSRGKQLQWIDQLSTIKWIAEYLNNWLFGLTHF